MRIGILLPTNVYFAPYSRVYTDIFDQHGISYDILYFDKRNLNEPAAYRFAANVSSTDGNLKRFWGYWRYARFLAKAIKREGYDRLIVCGPQIAIFLYPFLKKHYAGKFILDYRDLSIEQRFMKRYRKLLAISAYNMISSPGFKRCLPEANYILSHKRELADLSIRDLAQRTYSSPAGIFRLCQKLGLKGYNEFKLRFISEVNRTEKASPCREISPLVDLATKRPAFMVSEKLKEISPLVVLSRTFSAERWHPSISPLRELERISSSEVSGISI